MLSADVLWQGAAPAFIGTFTAGIIAIIVVRLTRRNDIALFQLQREYKAIEDLLKTYIATATVLEAPLEWRDGGKSYGEWLMRYLRQIQRHAYVVFTNAPLISDERLRKALYDQTNYLYMNLPGDLGRIEKKLMANVPEMVKVMEELKMAAHAAVSKTNRKLTVMLSTDRKKFKLPVMPAQSESGTIWDHLNDEREADRASAAEKPASVLSPQYGTSAPVQ